VNKVLGIASRVGDVDGDGDGETRRPDARRQTARVRPATRVPDLDPRTPPALAAPFDRRAWPMPPPRPPATWYSRSLGQRLGRR
jgi:hypothetical protein